MPEYAHQTDRRRKAKLQGQANHAHKTVDAAKRFGDYLVVGRAVSGKTLWDVYYQTPKGQVLVGRDFAFAQEAEEFIRDRRKGVIAVGWAGGLKGRFQQAGSLLVPLRDVRTPADSP